MPTEQQLDEVNLTVRKSVLVEAEKGRRYGDVLSTLSELFSNTGQGVPPAVLLVESEADTLHDAARVMAKNLGVPLIIADADFGIDEIQGAPVGRIESVGDSLFHKMVETGKGVLVIDAAEDISDGNRRILGHVFGGKKLSLPGQDHAVDFSGWTVVLGAGDRGLVAHDLKDKAAAAIRLDGVLPPQP